MAAKVLKMRRDSAVERMRRIPELVALYGNRHPDAVVPEPPSPLAVQVRDPSQMPAISLVEQHRTDAEMVKQTERLIHEGLEKVGVAKETLDKIRTLRGIEVTAGQIIAQSVSDIYQLYYIELMNIPARREKIKREILENEAVDAETKMFWQKADTELFEQMGRGLDRFINGTQVMLAMQRGKEKTPEKEKKKPGW